MRTGIGDIDEGAVVLGPSSNVDNYEDRFDLQEILIIEGARVLVDVLQLML